ncbi:hypothetical protein [Kitasatospora sp. NPDC085464]|uniref:hypothetical protein n=1 Tax=Kitasatospora sp. NPDC085464 TaxID=3364063 RepID=UPI0037C9530C
MGEKNRALKAAVRQRMAETGVPYRAAMNAVKAEYERGEHAKRTDDSAGDTLFIVDFPAPVLAGADPCPACHGAGLGSTQYEQRTDSGIVLIADTACTTCFGCGRAEHETRCLPGDHATDDPSEIEDYQELLDLDAEKRGEDPEERCYSCRGRRFWWAQAINEEAAEQGHAELQKRAQARGVSMDQVQAARAWGELDQLLGDGTQALFHQGMEFVRMPCGCTEGEGRRLTRAQFEAEQESAAQVPGPRDGGRTYEVVTGGWTYVFTGCPDLGNDIPSTGRAGEEPGHVIMAERRRQAGVIDGFVMVRQVGRRVTYRWVASGEPETVLPQLLAAVTANPPAPPVEEEPEVVEPAEQQVRQVVYEGGPWDGQERTESLAFVVGQQEVPTNGGGRLSTWGEHWADDMPRYMPVQDGPRRLRMVWAAPADPGAPRAYGRPEPLDDFGDHD